MDDNIKFHAAGAFHQDDFSRCIRMFVAHVGNHFQLCGEDAHTQYANFILILVWILIREGLCQPLERIYLDAIDPDLKMEMRAGDTSGGADLSDQLPGLDMVPDSNEEF